MWLDGSMLTEDVFSLDALMPDSMPVLMPSSMLARCMARCRLDAGSMQARCRLDASMPGLSCTNNQVAVHEQTQSISPVMTTFIQAALLTTSANLTSAITRAHATDGRTRFDLYAPEPPAHPANPQRITPASITGPMAHSTHSKSGHCSLSRKWAPDTHTHRLGVATGSGG